jgi:hypothetical protein
VVKSASCLHTAALLLLAIHLPTYAQTPAHTQTLAYVQSRELRDPTRPGWSPANPAAEAVKPVPNLLTAIVLGPNKRLALIGKQYLAVGDRLGDARIVRIDFDQVVLQSSSGQRIMRLTPVLETRTKAAKVNGS